MKRPRLAYRLRVLSQNESNSDYSIPSEDQKLGADGVFPFKRLNVGLSEEHPTRCRL